MPAFGADAHSISSIAPGKAFASKPPTPRKTSRRMAPHPAQNVEASGFPCW